MTINNAREEKWSSWIDWNGGECPLPDGAMHEVEYRTGERCKDDLPETSYWGCDGDDCDIIAYRYRLSDNTMTEAEEEIRAEEWTANDVARDDFGNEYHDDRADMVNAPPHYQLREGYEVYDLRQDLAQKAMAANVPHDQYSDWDRALEYLLRMWDKNGVEDAKKGRWYMDKLISKLEKKQ